MMKTSPKMRITSSEPGMSIRFVADEEAASFKKEEKELIRRHKALLAEKYGRWLSNEDSYVKDEP